MRSSPIPPLVTFITTRRAVSGFLWACMKSIITLFATFALVLSTAFSAAPTAFTVKVTGHGRPMILIPGLTCPGDVWDTTVEHFKDRYECHVLSLAGFGGSPAKPGPVLEPARDELAAYIKSHQLVRPIIVGHSSRRLPRALTGHL
ncbi:MAG: alpha/beta hydrolase [Nibricoccus sp.]